MKKDEKKTKKVCCLRNLPQHAKFDLMGKKSSTASQITCKALN